MGIRREARVNALRSLYLIDVCRLGIQESIDSIRHAGELNPETLEFMSAIVKGTIQNLAEIDEIIKSNAKNWTIDRMASVDRNILRIGTYELMKTHETPVNVIINEAIEIAKNYSSLESSKFVNGILDKIKEVRKQI